MWPGENSESSDRAVNLGVGAASPLWPGFLLAAAAGVAYWGWTRWLRPDALAKPAEPDLSAPPASTKGTPVAAKEPDEAEVKLPEAPAPMSAALEATEAFLSPPPETTPAAAPIVDAPAEPSLQAAAVAPVAEAAPTIPPPVVTPKVEAKPAAAKTAKTAKPAAAKTLPEAAPVKAATAKQSAPKTKAAAKPKASAPAEAPKPAPTRRKAPSPKT